MCREFDKQTATLGN